MNSELGLQVKIYSIFYNPFDPQSLEGDSLICRITKVSTTAFACLATAFLFLIVLWAVRDVSSLPQFNPRIDGDPRGSLQDQAIIPQTQAPPAKKSSEVRITIIPNAVDPLPLPIPEPHSIKPQSTAVGVGSLVRHQQPHPISAKPSLTARTRLPSRPESTAVGVGSLVRRQQPHPISAKPSLTARARVPSRPTPIAKPPSKEGIRSAASHPHQSIVQRGSLQSTRAIPQKPMKPILSGGVSAPAKPTKVATGIAGPQLQRKSIPTRFEPRFSLEASARDVRRAQSHLRDQKKHIVPRNSKIIPGRSVTLSSGSHVKKLETQALSLATIGPGSSISTQGSDPLRVLHEAVVVVVPTDLNPDSALSSLRFISPVSDESPLADRSSSEGSPVSFDETFLFELSDSEDEFEGQYLRTASVVSQIAASSSVVEGGGERAPSPMSAGLGSESSLFPHLALGSTPDSQSEVGPCVLSGTNPEPFPESGSGVGFEPRVLSSTDLEPLPESGAGVGVSTLPLNPDEMRKASLDHKAQIRQKFVAYFLRSIEAPHGKGIDPELIGFFTRLRDVSSRPLPIGLLKSERLDVRCFSEIKSEHESEMRSLFLGGDVSGFCDSKTSELIETLLKEPSSAKSDLIKLLMKDLSLAFIRKIADYYWIMPFIWYFIDVFGKDEIREIFNIDESGSKCAETILGINSGALKTNVLYPVYAAISMPIFPKILLHIIKDSEIRSIMDKAGLESIASLISDVENSIDFLKLAQQTIRNNDEGSSRALFDKLVSLKASRKKGYNEPYIRKKITELQQKFFPGFFQWASALYLANMLRGLVFGNVSGLISNPSRLQELINRDGTPKFRGEKNILILPDKFKKADVEIIFNGVIELGFSVIDYISINGFVNDKIREILPKPLRKYLMSDKDGNPIITGKGKVNIENLTIRDLIRSPKAHKFIDTIALIFPANEHKLVRFIVCLIDFMHKFDECKNAKHLIESFNRKEAKEKDEFFRNSIIPVYYLLLIAKGESLRIPFEFIEPIQEHPLPRE